MEKGETGAFENSILASSAAATGLVPNGMSLGTAQAQVIDYAGQG